VPEHALIPYKPFFETQSLDPMMPQGREISAWLRAKSLEGGISGGWVLGMKDSGVDLWWKLQGLTRKGVAEIGQKAGCAESEWDLVFDLIRGIGDEFKGQVCWHTTCTCRLITSVSAREDAMPSLVFDFGILSRRIRRRRGARLDGSTAQRTTSRLLGSPKASLLHVMPPRLAAQLYREKGVENHVRKYGWMDLYRLID